MSDATYQTLNTPETVQENETVIIDHGCDIPDYRHVHHQREVACKAGTKVLTIEPMLIGQGDKLVGHDQRHRYVRTSETDSQGRAIFRQENGS